MNMLTEYQVELIHREVDGENTPEASDEVRKLVAAEPEAQVLLNNLQSLDALFGEVPYREAPPGLREAINNAMSVQGTKQQTITQWAAQQWNGVSNFMGELMSTKKILIGATTAVAAIALIGYALVGYPPSGFEGGTIGTGDGMGGVTKAERYKGKTITEKDVSLSNPQIMALFQNDGILKLVKSEEFKKAMRDETFRELQSSELYQELMSSEVYQELMSSEVYQELMSSEAYQELMSSEAYQELMSNETYQQLMSSEAYLELMSSEAYLELMSSEAYQELMSSELFLQISQSPAMSELFLSEAMQAQY